MAELKRYERGAEIAKEERKQPMIQLIGYDIYPEDLELLCARDTFTQEDFEQLFTVKTGSWYVEDGWVVGKNPEMCPGMIVSKQDYLGNTLLEITAKMVAPSTHDINVMINGEWDDTLNRRVNAYVAGMEGFWHGCIGFEKSPDYKLWAATQLLQFDPTKEYRFKMGSLNGRVFVMVNDMIALQVSVPEPIDLQKYGKIGFEAFSSWWKFKEMRVYRIHSEFVKEYYNREF